MTTFLFASMLLQGPISGDVPIERTDTNSRLAHQQMVEKVHKGKIDVYFVGDSIIRRWGTSDVAYKDFLANWKQNFHGWNAGDFGWGGDTTNNILWRLQNGELGDVRPKAFVILAGTNNVGNMPGDDTKVESVVKGVKAIVEACRKQAPRATIVLTAIFPRNDNPAVVPTINRINEQLAKFARGRRMRWVNVNGKLADETGKLHEGMTVDNLHPSLKGYQIWADALNPVLEKILGPRATTDLSPPPTGDPSAVRKTGG